MTCPQIILHSQTCQALRSRDVSVRLSSTSYQPRIHQNCSFLSLLTKQEMNRLTYESEMVCAKVLNSPLYQPTPPGSPTPFLPCHLHGLFSLLWKIIICLISLTLVRHTDNISYLYSSGMPLKRFSFGQKWSKTKRLIFLQETTGHLLNWNGGNARFMAYWFKMIQSFSAMFKR